MMVLRKVVLFSLLALALPVAANAPLSPVWGAKGSEVFHTSQSCPAFRRVLPGNRVTFASAEDARKDGRRLCKKCR